MSFCVVVVIVVVVCCTGIYCMVLMCGCLDAYSEDIHASPSDSHPDMHSLPAHETELDFYETNCHWRGCGLEFETQEELVQVCNNHVA